MYQRKKSNLTNKNCNLSQENLQFKTINKIYNLRRLIGKLNYFLKNKINTN